MKVFFKLCIGFLFAITLTGCFGEEYDFSPPTVILVNPDNITQKTELAESNLDWHFDEQYNKLTDDIQSLAKKQTKIELKAGQQIELNIENGHFDPNGISVSVWQNDNKTDLEYQKNDQSFYLPKEKGDYMIVVDLNTDKGNAQYVGNVVIE